MTVAGGVYREQQNLSRRPDLVVSRRPSGVMALRGIRERLTAGSRKGGAAAAGRPCDKITEVAREPYPVSWLCDMDGVLINDGAMVPGADQFLEKLRATGRRFLILTNNSLFTPGELCAQLSSMGLHVHEEQLWTSALATAHFVQSQRPNGTALVIGEKSMHSALSDVGYREDCDSPDYVVLGETQDYSFDEISTAIKLIARGSHFVATNPEPTGTSPDGPLPGCGALAAMIERATGVSPYFVGKPNSVMIREGLNILGAHSKSTVLIGDRMDTDMLAGIEAGLQTILVLSGVATRDDLDRYAYRPSLVINSVLDLLDVL